MTGERAETLALWWLRLKGWRLIERRRGGKRGSGAGEIDLIMRRGKLLAFVEVKFRPTWSQAFEAIRPAQQTRIARAAQHFIANRPEFASLSFRFDAVLLVPGRLPRHIPRAWENRT